MQTSSDSAVRILLVEDDEDDYILTRDLLDSVPDYRYTIEWVTEYDAALATMRFNPYDVCLLDNRLGEQNGIDLLAVIGEAGAAMRAGVSDFLVKDQLSPDLLERVIRFSIERHRLTAELELLAKYDSLTGLANRMLFQDFLDGAIGRADRGHRQLGLMFLDLDFFKYINDTYGHLVGDELLIEVAKRLKSCVRAGDLVARLGGDEFAIVLDDIGTPARANHSQ
jgi:PleD family two-component response regulator